MGNYAGITIQGETRFDNLGASASSAGDLNGDGIDDFIFGAPNATDIGDYDFSGAAYVVFGDASGGLPASLTVGDLDGTNGFRITPEGGTDETGYYSAASYDLGTFVAGIGDINGDGIDDIAVAGETARYAGRYGGFDRPNFIYVVFGSDQGFADDLMVGELDGASGFQIAGVDGLVNGISAAGDVNGDGLIDLLISQSPVPDVNYGGYYGVFDGAEVASALAAGQPYAGYVIFGDASIGDGGTQSVLDLDGVNGFGVVTDRSSFTQNFYGEGGFYSFQDFGGVAALGDVNGDGFDDIGVQAKTLTGGGYYYNPTTQQNEPVPVMLDANGYVIFGQNTPFAAGVDPSDSGQASPLAWGELSYSTQGYSVYDIYDRTVFTGIGDINGDGFDDVAVSDPNRTLLEYNGGANAIGIVGVMFGGPDGVTFAGDGLNVNGNLDPSSATPFDLTVLKSDGAFDLFGANIAGVGDANGDGVDDFIIAATRDPFIIDGPSEPSDAYLIFGQDGGGATPLPPVIDLDALDQPGFDATGYRFVANEEDASLGAAISGFGDFNGDGITDFVITAPYADVESLADGGTNAGEAYIVFGGAAALEAADNADGANDNVIDVTNLAVNVDTGVLPIEVSVRNAGFVSQSLQEGDVGDTVFTFEVQRTGNLQEIVSFDFAVTGSGFDPAEADDFAGDVFPTGVASFAAGEAVTTVEVRVGGDLDIEGSETFTLTISNAATDGASPISIAAADSTIGRIVNDDAPVRFFALNRSVTEGDDPSDASELEMTVFRSGETQVEATVDFEIVGTGFSTSADAADFESGFPQSGTLTFAAGETSKTITLPIAEDVDIEANESIRLNLSNPTATPPAGSPPGTVIPVEIADAVGFGTILNDDFPPRIFVAGGGFVSEGDSGFTPITFTINRTGDTTGATEVTYDLNPLPSPGDFFAADSNDIDGFLPSFGNVVRFEDGESVKTVTVNVNGDGIIEPRESFELRITEVETFNGVSYDIFTPARTGTILNDDGRPPVIPPGVEADVFGDPHIVTLDGLGYDFQAVGEYILVETLPGADNPFQVQVRFEPLPGSDLVSVTTRMAVEIDGVTVEIDALGAETLLIDGVAPSADQLSLGAIDVNGDDVPDIFIDDATGMFTIVLNDQNEQLMVKAMDGALNVCVFLADTPTGNQANVRGLMGDADGDGTRSDDIALRDGTVLTQPVDFADLYGQFADSWRLDGTNGKDAGFSGATPTFPADFPAATLKIDDLPADLRAQAEAAAIAAGLDPVEDAVIFEAAVLDFALTGNDAFLEGALGLAADPQETAEPGNAPEAGLVVGVTDGAPGVPVTEGDAGEQGVTFSFYRIGDATGELTVDFSIGGDVDADDLSDGTGTTGSVTFADGQTTATFDIGVKGDLTTEDDEALTVTITGTSDEGALVGASSASKLILTDDFAPVAADDDFSTDEDSQVAGDLLAANPDVADSDADGDDLTITGIVTSTGQARSANGGLIILPSGAHLRVNEDGTFTYDPFGFTVGIGSAVDTTFDRLDDGEIATDMFTYTVSDGNGGFDTATATINVSGANDAPDATIDEFTLTEDEVLTEGNVIDGTIRADIDPEGGPLTVTMVGGQSLADADEDAATDGTQVTLQGGGIMTIFANGDVMFDTNGAYERLGDKPGQLVSDLESISYTVADEAGLTDSTSVRFSVRGVNDAPGAMDDAFATGFNEPLRIDFAALLANDVDPEGDDLTIVDIGGPNFGNFGDGGEGFITYIPPTDGTTQDSFEYTISDGFETSTATVTISIAPNTPPDAMDDLFIAFVGVPLRVEYAEFLENDVDADGDEIEIVDIDVSGVDEEVVTFDDTGFVVTAPADIDALTFSYTISDGFASDTATVSVEIEEAPGDLNPIFGTPGRDILIGTDQADRIDGLGGPDLMTGGGGGDEFVVTRSVGVTDFETGIDKIDLTSIGVQGIEELIFVERPGRTFVIDEASGARFRVAGDDGSPELTEDSFIFAATENLTLTGGDGRDDLVGRAGDDTISGGAESDFMTGNGGADLFVISTDGPDTVQDFMFGEDVLDISAWGVTSFDDLQLFDRPASGLIEVFGGGSFLRLSTGENGLVAADLDENAFHFADAILT